MSALEQAPLPSSRERRIGERMRLDRVLAVQVGRFDGTFVDLSSRGARIRHHGTLQRGSSVRITFTWERERFSATAQVLASRVVALGTSEAPLPLYESRFHFVYVDHASGDLLGRVLTALANEALRTWVGNLRAVDIDAGPRTQPPVPNGFIRCERINRRWQQKWTTDSKQPEHGFLLPAGTEPADVQTLCEAWDSMDEDGRHLLQLTATAVVEGAL